ncbi:MAG: hypothetical protein EON58_04165 [Alphaproteobacteria bacterium]|nr:MAG: hypothetical protein EON58_04165 [Alphaproteobacteria bacterium]
MLAPTRFLLVFCSGFSLLAVWGPFFWPPLDALGQGTPVLLAINLIAVVCAVIFGRLRSNLPIACLAGLAVLSSGYAIVRGWPRAERAEPGGQPLRVATCNLWMSNRSSNEAATQLAKINADILLLQELSPTGPLSLAAIADAFPYKSECNYCSQAIWSRMPITVRGSSKVDWPLPQEQQQLGIVWAKIAINQQTEIGVVSIHLSHADTSGKQLDELDALKRVLEPFDEKTLLVGGDFNASPDMLRYSKFVSDTGLRRVSFWPTWPDSLGSLGAPGRFPVPFMAIDHILAGSSWASMASRSEGGLGSDHYCAVAEIALQR